MRLRPIGILTLTGLVGLSALAVPAAAQTPQFAPPVDAEVARGFEEPTHRYGPGHRGIDYEVPSGTPVRAAGNGTVSFAGSVGGQGLFVTLGHAGDIQTTYSYLSAVEVAEREQVTQGQVIGQSGAGHPDGPPALHFGAKRAGEYIDPLLLLGLYQDITELLELKQAALARIAAGGPHATPQFPTLTVTDAVPLVTGPDALEPFREPDPSLGVRTPPPTLGIDELERRDEREERIEELLAREPKSLAEQKQAEEAERQAQADQQAAETADWWDSLADADKERLIKERPQDLGDRVGIPIEERDRANREALAKRIEFLEERQEKMEEAWEEAGFDGRLGKALIETYHTFPDTPIFGGFLEKGMGIDGLLPHERELEGAKALARELERLDERQAEDFPGSDVFLMDFDTAFADGDGTAVISIGNPEKAEHIGRVIPGLNNSLANIDSTTKKAEDIQRGVIVGRSAKWAAENSAIIAWLGYDTPNGFSDGFFDDEAKQGARKLSEFTRELRAARSQDHGDIAIHDYAHSFGTTVQGRATCGGMIVDDSVHLGSPGAGCSGLEQLHYGADRVWAGTALNDPIHIAAIMAPLGPNPNWDRDVRRLPLDSHEKQSGHGGYFNPQTIGMDNLVKLQVGDHEAVQ